MCRFLCYSGPEILLSELLCAPTNSLISQSCRSSEQMEPLNGDGFGVGWYMPDITTTPAAFKSTTPAWSNRNLRSLAGHVRSTLFFAHVRAASPGMPVSEANCHPFLSGRFLWMHNGFIAGFSKIKRRLRASLPDELYLGLEGSTDSEHAFAVFLHILGNRNREASAQDLGRALVETLGQLERWRSETGVKEDSCCNFAVTDGNSVAAVRYVSNPFMEPISLYYSSGKKYMCCDGVCQMADAHESQHTVIICSEPLTRRKADWVRVAPNHLVLVTGELDVSLERIEVPVR